MLLSVIPHPIQFNFFFFICQGTSFCLTALLKFNKTTNCVSSYYITLIAHDSKDQDRNKEFQVQVDETTYGSLDLTCSLARLKDEKGDLTKKKKPDHGGALAEENVIFQGGLPDLDLSNTKRFYMVRLITIIINHPLDQID